MRKKDKRGFVGLNILLSIIIGLFIIGILITIFSLMGGEFEEAGWDFKTISFINITLERKISSLNNTNVTGINANTYRSCSLTLTQVINETGNSAVALVPATNYTINPDCSININAGSQFYNHSKWNATGSYTYYADTTASRTINSSTKSLSETPSYMPLIIVIAVMVVLILLTVLIIGAIRGSFGEYTGKGERLDTA